MLNFTSYYQQAIGVVEENLYQLETLKLADASTAWRERGKVGSVIGTIGLVSSLAFGYNPTCSIVFTAISALTWYGCRSIALKLEPEALSILEHFKKLTMEKSAFNRRVATSPQLKNFANFNKNFSTK